MRFKTSVRNISVFTKITASLSSLGKVAWIRLDDNGVRFTVIPEQGSQVWAVLAIDTIFEDYTISSASPNNTINIELPLPELHRALKSAFNASSASIRMTKKDGTPVLSLTVCTSAISSGHPASGFGRASTEADEHGDEAFSEEPLVVNRDREIVITQNVPIRILSMDSVADVLEPRMREPDAYIKLPSLVQLKGISDRFTKLAVNAAGVASRGASHVHIPKLELSANMFGTLRLSTATDALDISSVWTDLETPVLDPSQVEGGDLDNHPSSKLRAQGPEAFATVRIDGRDWSKVLSIGRLSPRVIACFVDEHALILYVYLDDPDAETDSVLTYYINSYSR